MGRLEKSEHAIVQRGVARKLLSMGHALPQWLLDTYKVGVVRGVGTCETSKAKATK